MPRSTTKRAVIFDFDGVVADSWALHERAWAEVLKPYGAKVPEGAMERSIGLSSVRTAELIIEQCELDVSALELGTAKSEQFAERATKVAPMAGAVEAIKRLSPDFPVAVTAARRRSGVEAFLRKFELEPQLAAIVTRDDLSADATLEDVLRDAVTQLEVPPARCVLVEDSRNGLLAAERVGLRSIAFDSNPKHEMDFSMADSTIRSLDELVPQLIDTVTAR